MSTMTLRLTELSYDVDRALAGELRRTRPSPLRVFRLRRLKSLIRQRFERLLRRG
ncbi:hypothetical protein [Sphingomonas astaxanthinifaciens]|uniref:Uncharacterized protein n=1 Tax=Sphingomonas astaxanthinifaciens DSM 22298 TaxID=1123267 RepID=A0ABQ5Z758_9SPHN|nr:hypothetical protein [Sphingomonas astaxanthinifaciens]GLR47366.1 hypothetical protein GCM10007925_10770 [Sphingomonas astaxanthinifaciens DSM 22298]